ncbi:HAD-IA family hydrolase [Vibrio quintilis]|uniref:Sugar phosphatase YfbT n=1 Tax=Vibrio quintilis TaxID=1117707 RepID=A0A1M7YY97_9VIBR|nr:HAD-IA family hydrolase [Vibrio quintilis]SHO57659.1 Sugar phosphatase YfbT [Vibrio quintilis]
MKNYKKFIFDMDGTLVDSKESVEKAWCVWANEHEIDVNSILAISHGRPGEEVIREIMPHLDIKKEAAKLEVTESEHVNSVKPVPGAIEFLSQLQDEDWGIFTSAPRELAIQRLKAASVPVPEILITVEDITNGKPHPEGYALAADRLGAESNQCLVFEDAQAGIQSAVNAGCDVIRILAAAPDNHPVADCLTVQDFFDVSVCLNGKKITLK